MSLSTGTRLGPYEVTAQIGVGGMGEVYRATDTKLNRDVAIKVLLPAVANDARSPRALRPRSAGPSVSQSSSRHRVSLRRPS